MLGKLGSFIPISHLLIYWFVSTEAWKQEYPIPRTLHSSSPLSSRASQVALEVKNLSATSRDPRDMGSIPGLGRSPGGGNGNPFQCSCLENPHGQRSLVGYSPCGHRVGYD